MMFTGMLHAATAAKLALLLAAGPGEVHISGARWRTVNPEADVIAPVRWVQHRTVEIEVVKGGLLVRGTWDIRATHPGFFAQPLLPADAIIHRARWDGKPAAVWSTSAGTFVSGKVSGRSTLTLEAFLPAPSGKRTFALLAATHGTVRLTGAPSLRVTGYGAAVVFVDGRYQTGAGQIATVEKAAPDQATGALLLAEVGVGLTVGDGAISGNAKVRWTLRRGSVQTVELDVRGVGTDLTLEGPNIADWTRTGDRVVVELKAPTAGRVDAELHWTTTLSKAPTQTVPLPTITPRGVLRFEASVQLARDGDLDVLPDLQGWKAMPAAALPEYGKGLVAGAPTAAYRKSPEASEGAKLRLFRFEPVEGPPVVVEIADVQIATSAEGRRLTLARYEVLNERSPFLDVEPPPGARVVGVWETGREVSALAVEGRLRIPLRRSLETVQGLLTFPVVVAFLEETPALRRRVHTEVQLPVVHAPVNVARTSVRIPRSYKSTLDKDTPGVVAHFTRGEEIGFGLKDPNAVAQADRVYAEALDAWQRNDFDVAREKLKVLEGSGARSKNQAGLGSNVSLVLGDTEPPADPAERSPTALPTDAATPVVQSAGVSVSKSALVGRRIRARARARSSGRRAKQRKFKKKAKALKDAGKYDEAAATYEQARSETRALRNLEDDDTAVYQFEEAEIDAEIDGLRQEAAAREHLESSSQRDAAEYAPFNMLEFDPVLAQPAPAPMATAPVAMPRGGTHVRYQYLLLAPGAKRTVPLELRRLPTKYRNRRRHR